ncbi:hypothetical protein IQ264_03885 [Phormidium sp. LEGE 05292]|uniref:hypothetical protein n=1 Tax=[Phormidium] sp. LEGE 05292 TaxID=767427 RepID=UPI0018814DD8|nr:hypothetical protein [Phormidium sp. LEGE 05292]MBE9224610.1 hypothetical protein [Phormidium sp. LEGE 05292]
MNNEPPINSDFPKDWHQETQVSWNTNASIWDTKMGDDGNDFHRLLVRPATEKLLGVKVGDRILDIGCVLTTLILLWLQKKQKGMVKYKLAVLSKYPNICSLLSPTD